MNELITIIIPVFNVEKYLKRCIESIINQTYKNIEIILVNDGSTDKSKEICEYYKTIDERIKLINKNNEGASSARNIGLDNCNGYYICFVDSDDYIEPDYIEYLYKPFKFRDVEISIIGSREIHGEKVISREKKINKMFYGNDGLKELLYERYFGPMACGKLYKKNIIGKERFRNDIKIGEDFEFEYRILKKAQLIYVNTIDVKYNYVIRENSAMTKKKDDSWDLEILICWKIVNEIKKENSKLYKYAIKRYIRSNVNCIIKLIREGEDIKCIEKYQKNIRNYRIQAYSKSNFLTKIKIFLIKYNITILRKDKKSYSKRNDNKSERKFTN